MVWGVPASFPPIKHARITIDGIFHESFKTEIHRPAITAMRARRHPGGGDGGHRCLVHRFAGYCRASGSDIEVQDKHLGAFVSIDLALGFAGAVPDHPGLRGNRFAETGADIASKYVIGDAWAAQQSAALDPI